ncbi:YigZ family protein [Desulfovibrio ferrophilus]|uniref:Impact family member HI_0722 n=1 Tax=Desulfovibrio ferrophilus TaxID=241368 RepID=A0A2Z6B0J5_9BACT|nr:YigZ family protein [Desulfovibrio ferrophilus]BBD08916.1 impact family member HI_0722 [Desulfovibrio ferrophilus]
MALRYPIPSADHRLENSIKRSRFIVSAAHAPDAETAKAFINDIRAEFSDATHNCWAFAAGPPGDTRVVGMSDDGEPHGTAGRPMLHALLHSGVGEVAVVVTRYYGGIKLGTGGLTRAYSGMVTMIIEDMPLTEKVETVRLRAEFDYQAVTQAKRLLPDYEATVLSEDYGERVAYILELPEEHAAALTEALVELTDGKAVITPVS